VQLKEAQYLRQIQRLEETLEQEAKERKARHEKLVESLREKHRNLIDGKDDEITELKIKLGDADEEGRRVRSERDSLGRELEKVMEEWRNFKDEAKQKFEVFSKQINQAEMKNEERNRALIHECEKQREDVEQMRRERKATEIETHELQVKLDGYKLDYERYFNENKRLRDHMNKVREEKDSAISELNRLQSIYHERVNELTDECNIKIARL
jgi:chromosome segregation ATPase